MMSAVLEAALTSEQRQGGFRLVEPDDHTVELCYQGKPVARFNSSTATVAQIRATAERIAKGQTS